MHCSLGRPHQVTSGSTNTTHFGIFADGGANSAADLLYSRFAKEIDERSQRFAEFGDFVIGMRRTPADLVTELGLADGEGA